MAFFIKHQRGTACLYGGGGGRHAELALACGLIDGVGCGRCLFYLDGDIDPRSAQLFNGGGDEGGMGLMIRFLLDRCGSGGDVTGGKGDLIQGVGQLLMLAANLSGLLRGWGKG